MDEITVPMPDPAGDVITPEWSRALALVGLSPFWRGVAGAKQRTVFFEAASAYPTYDALPPRLKAMFQAAQRQMQAQTR